MVSNIMIAIAVVAVLSVGGVAVYVLTHDGDGDTSTLDSAELKVLGNANGDIYIDDKDVKIIEKLIADGASAEDNPLADANYDKKIDKADLEVVKNIIAGKSTKIWHANYHDTDGDSVMDLEPVETRFPVSSAIMTGSANSFMMCYMLDIIDEIKGASYGSTNDKTLYGPHFMNTKAVAKLGTSSTSIAFEDGKAGSSDVIANENVTCVLSDWNRTYLTNEDKFEAAGIDVVRISAASTEKDVYTHSILLLGLLFQENDNAKRLLDLYNKTFDKIDDLVGGLSSKKKLAGVASSSNGSISSGNSDYQAVLSMAGLEFGLKKYDFGSAASVKVADNLGIYDTSKYNWDRIVHLRTAIYYNATAESISETWKKYTEKFSDWEHYDEDGSQIIISGVIPVPVRVAYTVASAYAGTIAGVDKAWADSIHQEFISGFYHDGNEDLIASEQFMYVDKDPLAA